MGELVKCCSINNGVLTIFNKQTPFKISKQKCHSYLDLHYPQLTLNDFILTRCCHIFNILLKYADGYEIVDKTVIWKESSGWRLYKSITIFNQLFFNESLSIVNCNPNKNDAYDTECTLQDLLINDEKYKMFNDYWLTHFNYDDLFKLLTLISIKLKFQLPSELIHKILLHT